METLGPVWSQVQTPSHFRVLEQPLHPVLVSMPPSGHLEVLFGIHMEHGLSGHS